MLPALTAKPLEGSIQNYAALSAARLQPYRQITQARKVDADAIIRLDGQAADPGAGGHHGTGRHRGPMAGQMLRPGGQKPSRVVQ